MCNFRRHWLCKIDANKSPLCQLIIWFLYISQAPLCLTHPCCKIIAFCPLQGNGIFKIKVLHDLIVLHEINWSSCESLACEGCKDTVTVLEEKSKPMCYKKIIHRYTQQVAILSPVPVANVWALPITFSTFQICFLLPTKSDC